MSGINQAFVDKSTEVFLDGISDKLQFNDWYFGHYHGDWDNGKYHLLFNSWKEL